MKVQRSFDESIAVFDTIGIEGHCTHMSNADKAFLNTVPHPTTNTQNARTR